MHVWWGVCGVQRTTLGSWILHFDFGLRSVLFVPGWVAQLTLSLLCTSAVCLQFYQTLDESPCDLNSSQPARAGAGTGAGAGVAWAVTY